MPVRYPVQEFVKLGPLPDCRAPEDVIRNHQTWLLRIEEPVSDDEAVQLISCFGPDDCYGLAWTLLHLIETAPSGIPIKQKPSERDNEWLRRLWTRSQR